ncbi:hypothetical protein LDENG_00150210, partial [Lucifuga dentata]
MTAAVFFGCTFIAFGPAIALFLFTIAREPLRVIFLIAGAFFWLVSLLLASLVWFVSVQVSDRDSTAQQKGLLVFGVLLSVLLQEIFRFAYYKLLNDKGFPSVFICSGVTLSQFPAWESQQSPDTVYLTHTH